MKIKKNLLCNRYFYQLLAILLDFHKFIFNDKLKKFQIIKEIKKKFADFHFQENYNEYLDIYFSSNSKNVINQDILDCFFAFCAVILIEGNFDIAFVKRELIGFFKFHFESALKQIKITPWFKYEAILTEKNLKEIGFTY